MSLSGNLPDNPLSTLFQNGTNASLGTSTERARSAKHNVRDNPVQESEVHDVVQRQDSRHDVSQKSRDHGAEQRVRDDDRQQGVPVEQPRRERESFSRHMHEDRAEPGNTSIVQEHYARAKTVRGNVGAEKTSASVHRQNENDASAIKSLNNVKNATSSQEIDNAAITDAAITDAAITDDVSVDDVSAEVQVDRVQSSSVFESQNVTRTRQSANEAVERGISHLGDVPMGSQTISPMGKPDDVSVIATEITATKQTEANTVGALGMVVDKFDAEAIASPIILSSADVKKAARSLLALGVQSPNPAQISHQDYALQTAIDVFGVVDALRQVIVQMSRQVANPKLTSEKPLGMVQFPASAQQPLEWLISLQTMLDQDSFAALFGGLPQLSIATGNPLVLSGAQLSNAVVPLDSANAGGNNLAASVIFVQIDTSGAQKSHALSGQTAVLAKTTDQVVANANDRLGGDPAAYAHTYRPSGVAVSQVPIADMQQAGHLPEWLADAMPRHSQVGYSVAKTSRLPGLAASDNGTKVRSLDSPVAGKLQRQSIDQQAALYSQQNSQHLPGHLKPLSQVPAVDSAAYGQWVSKVASLIREAEVTTPSSASGRETYVFNDSDILRLMKMLPLASLRDVVRMAGDAANAEKAAGVMGNFSPNNVDDAFPDSSGLVANTPTVDSTHSTSVSGSVSGADASAERRVNILDQSHDLVRRAHQDSRDLSQRLSQRFDRVFHPQDALREYALHVMEDAQDMSQNSGQVSRQSVGDMRDVRQVIQQALGANPVALKMARDQQRKENLVKNTDARQPQANTVRVVNFADNGVDASTTSGASSAVSAVGSGVASAGITGATTDGALNMLSPSQNVQTAQRNAKRLAQVRQMAQQIRAQIVRQVAQQAQDNTSRIELQLNPKRLGKVDIEIVQDAGKTAIRFSVENADTLDSLREDIDSLIESLREAGVATDQGAMEFTLKEGNQQQAEQKRKQAQTSVETEDEEEILALGQLAEADADGHINIKV